MKRVEFRVRSSVALAGIALLSGVLPAGSAFAQTSDGAGVPTPPGAMRMGPLAVYPTVGYELMRNDNIFLQAPNSGLVRADTIQVLRPEVRAEAKQGEHIYGGGLAFQLGRYNSFAQDDYDNFNAFVNADLNPDTRVRIRLKADHTDAHDPRGSTTDALTLEPSRYRAQNLGGVFGYGAQGAQGRFELELNGYTKRYYNNSASGVQDNNRDDATIGGTFFWRVAPKTSLLAQVKRTGIDYNTDVARSDPNSLDSTEMRYYVGATWEATAATTGVLKLGMVNKDFKSGARTDESTPSWDAQIQWTPLTYSKVDFTLGQAYRETTTGFGDTVRTTNNSVIWTHKWTSQVSTRASGTYGLEDYKGLTTPRNDKLPGLGLRGTYQMRRWLDFGADYSWSKRESNIDSAAYKKNVIMLFVNATL